MNAMVQPLSAAIAATTAARVNAHAPLLELDRLSRHFDIGGGLFTQSRTLRAVDEVSLSVPAGSVLGIVGESGSGKTTMARMMLGLLAPSSGQMRIDGVPVGDIDRTRLARQIQPIFQDPYSSLNPRKTVAQIIGLALDIHRLGTSAQRRAKVIDMMDRVGLPARLAHAYPNQLSGGQRQRVAIARALVLEPRIVLCDEPTSALDVSVQAQILNLLKELRAQLDLTYVFISHDLGVIDYIADHVAVMYLGRIVEYGPARQVIRAPRHPYTQALMQSVLTPQPELGLPDLALAGTFPDPLNPPAGCPFHPRCIHARPECQTVPPAAVQDSDGYVRCVLYGTPAQAMVNIQT
jgi:peptide/nickel transport system ATP-binding protein